MMAVIFQCDTCGQQSAPSVALPQGWRKDEAAHACDACNGGDELTEQAKAKRLDELTDELAKALGFVGGAEHARDIASAKSAQDAIEIDELYRQEHEAKLAEEAADDPKREAR